MKIDKIYFINLSKRTDRLEHIENVLFNKLKIPKQKVMRVEGVYVEHNGALGCALSHIKILSDVLKHKHQTTLILEDDFDVNDTNLFWESINNLSIKKWDLIQVSANLLNYEPSDIQRLVRVLNSQTTSGYLINIKFVRKLLDCFKESSRELTNSTDFIWAIDQNWKKLQKNSKWYCFLPKLGYQINGFSDIEKTDVDYKC